MDRTTERKRRALLPLFAALIMFFTMPILSATAQATDEVQAGMDAVLAETGNLCVVHWDSSSTAGASGCSPGIGTGGWAKSGSTTIAQAELVGGGMSSVWAESAAGFTLLPAAKRFNRGGVKWIGAAFFFDASGDTTQGVCVGSGGWYTAYPGAQGYGDGTICVSQTGWTLSAHEPGVLDSGTLTDMGDAWHTAGVYDSGADICGYIDGVQVGCRGAVDYTYSNLSGPAYGNEWYFAASCQQGTGILLATCWESSNLSGVTGGDFGADSGVPPDSVTQGVCKFTFLGAATAVSGNGFAVHPNGSVPSATYSGGDQCQVGALHIRAYGSDPVPTGTWWIGRSNQYGPSVGGNAPQLNVEVGLTSGSDLFALVDGRSCNVHLEGATALLDLEITLGNGKLSGGGVSGNCPFEPGAIADVQLSNELGKIYADCTGDCIVTLAGTSLLPPDGSTEADCDGLDLGCRLGKVVSAIQKLATDIVDGVLAAMRKLLIPSDGAVQDMLTKLQAQSSRPPLSYVVSGVAYIRGTSITFADWSTAGPSCTTVFGTAICPRTFVPSGTTLPSWVWLAVLAGLWMWLIATVVAWL